MSSSRQLQVVLRLASLPGIGPAKARSLLEALHDQETDLDYLLDFDRADLLGLGLNDDQADAFAEADVADLAAALEESEIGLVTMLDPDAPSALLQPRLSPWFFYSGDLDVLRGDGLSFSGSRDASEEALQATSEIAASAAEAGIVVVSGGARGVDMAAHRAALAAGGSTVIVLAQGLADYKRPVDLQCPRALVLSEFLPLDEWGSYRAMQRNKSIIHLSSRLVIPQAGVNGGTRNAAEYALKQGHPTWVLDLGPDYPGNNRVIRAGATALSWPGPGTDIDRILTQTVPIITQPPLF